MVHKTLVHKALMVHKTLVHKALMARSTGAQSSYGAQRPYGTSLVALTAEAWLANSVVLFSNCSELSCSVLILTGVSLHSTHTRQRDSTRIPYCTSGYRANVSCIEGRGRNACTLTSMRPPRALLCLVYYAGRAQSCFLTILRIPSALLTGLAPDLHPAPFILNSIPHSDTLPMHMYIPLCTGL